MGAANSPFICDVCKGKFSFEEIRYTKDGKSITCLKCYNKTKDKFQKTKSDESFSSAIRPQTVNLICVDCGYRFTLRKKSKISPRCPYCSKDRIIIDDITAEKILREVSGEGKVI